MLGVLLGGALTQGFSWRAIFWFLTCHSGCVFILFLLVFKDTFRRERSSTYQTVLKKRRQERDQKHNQSMVVAGTHTCPDRNIQLSFKDVNPLPPLLLVLRQLNNLAILFSSGESPIVVLYHIQVLIISHPGLVYAFTVSITYTCARTMSNKYNYNALETGLVLLAFGIGVCPKSPPSRLIGIS